MTIEVCARCGVEALEGMLIRDSVDSSQLRCQNCIGPDKKSRKPRKRKEKPVIAAAAPVVETIVYRVPEQETVDYDVLRKDAQVWAQECGLGQVRLDGPNRENFPQYGFGYVFQVIEVSGKQRRATARYNSRGLRNFWSMDSLVTG